MIIKNSTVLFFCLMLASSLTLEASFFGPVYDLLEKEAFEVLQSAQDLIKKKLPPTEFEQIMGNIENKKYVCTGGVHPSDISYKEYLNRFAEGPCSPTVVIPGITGTKLQVVIDCEKFKDNNPELFKTCGWDTCKTGLFKSSPKSEYLLWVPGMTSPVSISGSKSKKDCFSGMLSLQYELTNGVFTPYERIGLTVAPVGQTPETKSTSECGFSAVEDLMPGGKSPEYRIIKETLQNAGYIAGLTMQAMPYDWRLTYTLHNLDVRFQTTIEELYQITGKKTIVIGHSMGNFQILHNLWKMTSDWKDIHISRYIGLAPPYLGAARTLLTPLGMDEILFKKMGVLTIGLYPE